MSSDIKKRLEGLERKAFFPRNQVSILGQTEDGRWRTHINGKEMIYNTKEEASADFHMRTGPESVLIIWDVGGTK